MRWTGHEHETSRSINLTMEEKRELVHRISNLSEGAPQLLQSWSRRELLQILCAEMGKERKYTGLTKIKMIEHLLRLVSKKNTNHINGMIPSTSLTTHPSSKRQRKADHPVRMMILANCSSNENGVLSTVLHCNNSACRAIMTPSEAFCRRCSCCICCRYDDNKDPSLWLVCNSEHPYEGYSCGMSCHLECALKNEKCGIAQNGMDGSFLCCSCKKVNDLLGCWKKQMMIAKDTRRVDILCYRIFLAYRLLRGTDKYQNLHKIVNTAAEKLKDEIGALDGLPIKMARGIVNRLSCGPEVQKLCAGALELLDSWCSCSQLISDRNIRGDGISPSRISVSFEDPSPTSVTIVLVSEDEVLTRSALICTLWHRRADMADYPVLPTCNSLGLNSRFLLMGLSPGTDYVCRVISYCDGRMVGNQEARLTTAQEAKKSILDPFLDGNESNNTGYENLNKSPTASGHKFEALNGHDLDPEGLHGDSTSVLDEDGVTVAFESVPNAIKHTESQRDSTNSSDENQASNEPKPNNGHRESQFHEEISIDNEFNPTPAENAHVGQSQSLLLVTPRKQEIFKDGPKGNSENRSLEPEEEPQAGSSSKKRGMRRCSEACVHDGSLESDYEYCVKVIRWLECEGYIEKHYRVKFLTWFSLRATQQERRVVSAYVETLIDDPGSLAGQLADTFSEAFCSRRPPRAPSGFCLKLWH